MYNNVDEATSLGHLTSEEDHSGNEQIPAPGNVYKQHRTHVTIIILVQDFTVQCTDLPHLLFHLHRQQRGGV